MADTVSVPLRVCPGIGHKLVSRCTFFDFDKELGYAKIKLLAMGSVIGLIEEIITAEGTYTSSLQGYIVKNEDITDTQIPIFEKAEFEVTQFRSTVRNMNYSEVPSATITVREIRN